MIFNRILGYRHVTGRWILAGTIALVAIALPESSRLFAQSSLPSFGNSLGKWAPIVASPGDEINLFSDWDGTQPADGLAIETEQGWEVIAVEASRLGRNDRVVFSLRRSVNGVIAEASERLFGRYRLIVTMMSPSIPSSATVSVTPLIRVEDSSGSHLTPQNRYEVEFDLNVEKTRPSSGHALRLSEFQARPVVVDLSGVPDLTDASGFTVAFWLKSVDRDKVVLSSWNGNEFEDYPFEFVIDAGGEMRVFSGRGGMHYSLGSRMPVADGTWHHVAYSVSFAGGLAVMTLDGTEVDSRFLSTTSHVEINRLSIGGRENQDGGTGEKYLNALIDELVLLPATRSVDEVSHMARVPIAAIESDGGTVLLDFEPGPARSRFMRVNPDADFAASDLMLHQPASDIVAEFHPGSVSLSWIIVRPEAQVIIVERSDDGVLFEVIHRTTIVEIDPGSSHQGERYSYEDFVSDDSPIYFYRISQEFADNSVIRSQMLKIGVGTLEMPTSVELIGNSPNPFSTSTEVYFSVLEPTSLRLSVWSVSGHLIKQLAAGTRDTGLYRIPFEAGDLPSGIYFLRLEIDQGVQTRKMIVRR